MHGYVTRASAAAIAVVTTSACLVRSQPAHSRIAMAPRTSMTHALIRALTHA